MLRKLLFLSPTLLIFSCGVVKKKTTYSETKKVTIEASEETNNTDRIDRNGSEENISAEETLEEHPAAITSPDKADNIVNTALTYSGVRYKFGGTTKKGMDCSGLLYVAFGENNIQLPRISYQMAEEGKRIRVNRVMKGDLLFFSTGRSKKRINHVGLVVEVDGDDIKFIHSSSSRGVIVSSLREGFWNYAFVKATRIL